MKVCTILFLLAFAPACDENVKRPLPPAMSDMPIMCLCPCMLDDAGTNGDGSAER